MVHDDQLHAFIVDARARTTVDVRRRRRWLRRQLDEDRSFADVMDDAATVGAAVDVLVTGGRRHRGRLVVASPELVGVATADGTAWIRGAAVVGIEVRGADGDAGHPDRRAPWSAMGRVLDDVLAELAGDGAIVAVGLADGTVHQGRIAGVGRDVVRITDGPHLRMTAVSEVIAPA